MFLSETFDVYDCTKYDNATQSSHNDDMWNSVSNLNRGVEYSYFGSSSPLLLYTSITGDVCIEIDVMTDAGLTEQLLSIREDSSLLRNLTLERLGMTSNTWKTVKLYIQNNILTVDGITGSEYDVTGFTRLFIRSGTNYTTYFRNLKIYPI